VVDYAEENESSTDGLDYYVFFLLCGTCPGGRKSMGEDGHGSEWRSDIRHERRMGRFLLALWIS
jgi:hypothetical protein